MPAVKFAVSGMKFGTALPIRFVEWTSNKIFGFAEMVVIGCELPTNITQVYRLNDGPKLINITGIKEPVLNFVIKQLEKWKKN